MFTPRPSPHRSVALRLLAALVVAAGAGARAAPIEPEPGPEPRLDSRFVGAFLDAGTYRSPAGVGALGDLGVRSFGIRGTSDRRWLALWDGFLSARGGYVANTRPGARLLGARGLADLEVGTRFPPGPWSGYAGAEGRLDVQTLRAVLSSRLPANELDGVTGLNTGARIRLDAGASYLGGDHSLLAVAFVQRARHPTASLGSSELFTEYGLGLRWDLAWLATASLEASWGRSGLKRDAALARTDETTHREVSANVWARLPHGPWLGVGGNASQESDRLVYTSSGTTFRTANSPTLGLTFSVGVPVGRTGG